MYVRNSLNGIRNTCRFISESFASDAPMKDLNRSIGWRALNIEGYLSHAQAEFFSRFLARNKSVTRILEIGFNAGHSSFIFLEARPDVTVVSFDLGAHGYVAKAKEFLDETFPGRHSLILGDSTKTVPAYQAEHPDASFDLIFIDGGHDYEVAQADLLNCQPLSRSPGLVVMDDLQPWKTWGAGPVRAWSEAKEAGAVEELQLLQDGEPVAMVERKLATSAWAVGRYSPLGDN